MLRNVLTVPIFDSSIKSLLDTVKTSLSRALRDNDLIYHHDVPASASLPPIQETVLATATVPPGLPDPKIVMGSMNSLFSNLIGWGARQAISKHFRVYFSQDIHFFARNLQ